MIPISVIDPMNKIQTDFSALKSDFRFLSSRFSNLNNRLDALHIDNSVIHQRLSAVESAFSSINLHIQEIKQMSDERFTNLEKQVSANSVTLDLILKAITNKV